MAIITSAQNGNWSDPNTWVGGVLPTSVDDVRLNHTVESDVDINISNLLIPSSNNLGYLNVTTSRNILVSNTIFNSKYLFTSQGLINITMVSGMTINITSNMILGIQGGGQFSQNGSSVRIVGSNGVVNIISNQIIGGYGSSVGIGSYGGAAILALCSNTILNITGSVQSAGQTANGYLAGVYSQSNTKTINIVGSVIGDRSIAIFSSVADTITISGTSTSINSPCSNSTTALFIVSGSIINGNNIPAFSVSRIRFNSSSLTQWTFQTEIGGTNKTLYPAGTDIGNPLPSNVRSGTVFGPNSEFTGTCAIPSATTVSLGVPVDNTIGTAVNNMSTIFNIQESQVTGKTIGTKILQIAPRKIGVSLIQNVGGVVLTNPQGLLLDLYPATSAYSLRRLSLNYINPLIRVRRGGDNSELEIGYDSNNELDITTLLSFVNNGDGNGFIVRWFDQTNNNNNVSQNTVLGQPQIVTSGSMILVNNKPSIRFNGTSQYLDGGNVILNPNNKNLLSFVVAKTPTTGVNYFYTRALPGGTPNRYALSNGTQFYGLVSDGNNVGRDAFTSNVTSNQSLYSQKIEVSVGHDIWRNNVQYGSNIFPNSFGNTTYNFLIGAYNNGSGTVPPSAFGAGEHQEYVIYQQASLPDRATISSIINSYYNIY